MARNIFRPVGKRPRRTPTHTPFSLGPIGWSAGVWWAFHEPLAPPAIRPPPPPAAEASPAALRRPARRERDTPPLAWLVPRPPRG